MRIPLSRPDIGNGEKQAVREVLETPDLSLGPKHLEFETEFARYTGSPYAISVSSGTAGLHLCVRALRIEPDQEVLTTPYSFVSSSNALLFEGALPVFVDVDGRNGNIDPERIRELIEREYVREGNELRNRRNGRVLAGFLVVHVFGHPCDMNSILALARECNVPVIEDACEALGARYASSTGQSHVGTEGDLSVFAFYPNKQITTGEGGMVLAKSESVTREIRSMRNQGRAEDTRELEHVRLGYNYRIDELSAALGLAQMRRIDEIVERRRGVARRYDELLEDIEEVRPLYVDPSVEKSPFVYVVRARSREMRDRIMERLQASDVGTRIYFRPIHMQPYYVERFGYREGAYPEAEALFQTTLALPFFNRLSEKTQGRVVDKIKESVSKGLGV